MEKDPEETPEEIIELTINTINTVEDEPLKSDLISVMSVISSKEFSKEMLMKSPLYQEWIAEEREEAADLNTINDEEILDSLFRKAVRIDAIESFETLLEKVQKGY